MEFNQNEFNLEKTSKLILKSDENLEELNKKMNLLLSFKNEENLYSDKRSLQENFKDFLKMRKELRKAKINEIPRGISFRDNPDRMEMLRKKFVDQAFSYLGIPYGKRYLSEDHPLFNSPIFLDCCGLIRQCVNDLKEDFGFMLGRWNQAYQFDLLPEIIEFKDLKRGDLIFYTATYYPEKKWKSQLHNMVHVEIFLGGKSGEETIAARDRFGVVEINETYKFTSENYYDIKYHFKCINTWLRGINKSFCKEHLWEDALLENKNNKYSLFSVNDNENVVEFSEEVNS